MFEKFTNPALEVISKAKDIAISFHHRYIEPEHVFLSFIESNSLSLDRLKSNEIEFNNIELAIKNIFNTNHNAEAIGFSDRCKNLLELSYNESRRLGDSFIQPRYILLGLYIQFQEGCFLYSNDLDGIFFGCIKEELSKPYPYHIGGSNPILELEAFDFFTKHALKAVSLSQEATWMSRNIYIQPRHLVLGVIREGKGKAIEIITAKSMNIYSTQKELLKIADEIDQIDSYKILSSIQLEKEIKKNAKLLEKAVKEQNFEKASQIKCEQEKIMKKRLRCTDKCVQSIEYSIKISGKSHDKKINTLHIILGALENIDTESLSILEKTAKIDIYSLKECIIQAIR